MALERRYDSTISEYDEIYELERAGALKDEAIKMRPQYLKMYRDYDRLSKAIKRDAPNIEGWTCIG